MRFFASVDLLKLVQIQYLMFLLSSQSNQIYRKEPDISIVQQALEIINHN
jgi:hypothetical protein